MSAVLAKMRSYGWRPRWMVNSNGELNYSKFHCCSRFKDSMSHFSVKFNLFHAYSYLPSQCILMCKSFHFIFRFQLRGYFHSNIAVHFLWLSFIIVNNSIKYNISFSFAHSFSMNFVTAIVINKFCGNSKVNVCNLEKRT